MVEEEKEERHGDPNHTSWPLLSSSPLLHRPLILGP